MTSPLGPKVNPKQIAFLLMDGTLEVLYGGAAGGGKSEALLQAASQYLDVPGYSALLLRRTFRDLNLPGALMSRAHQWWDGTEAHWDDGDHIWRFPEGSTVQFGYLARDEDFYNYQSAEFHFIGFDELTQFTERQYTYLFSRLRRLKRSTVPMRMRSATNPGGSGHEWVRDRFNLPLGPKHPRRGFVPATVEDNPYLDLAEYEHSFEQLGRDSMAFKQLREGDWSAMYGGAIFDPSKVRIVEPEEVDPYALTRIVRYWDLAASAPSDLEPDPDYTVGVKLARTRFGRDDYADPDYWVLDVARQRADPRGVEGLVHHTARADGKAIPIWIEQERGGAGKLLVQQFAHNVVPDYPVRPLYVTGSKETRATPVAGVCNAGRLYLVRGDWNQGFLDELYAFPEGAHDDQVDALSGAFIALDREDYLDYGSQVKEW